MSFFIILNQTKEWKRIISLILQSMLLKAYMYMFMLSLMIHYSKIQFISLMSDFFFPFEVLNANPLIVHSSTKFPKDYNIFFFALFSLRTRHLRIYCIGYHRLRKCSFEIWILSIGFLSSNNNGLWINLSSEIKSKKNYTIKLADFVQWNWTL